MTTLSATNSSTAYSTLFESLLRSAVSTAVTPSSRMPETSRSISRRTLARSSKRLKTASSESIEMREAFTRRTACSMRAMRAPRSNVPITVDSSPGCGDTSTKAQRFSRSHRPMSQPIEATFWQMSPGDSSKVTNTPPSPASTPLARNCVAKIVLPAPAVPVTSVARPADRPPSAIRSNPGMPVGSFRIASTVRAPFTHHPHQPSPHSPAGDRATRSLCPDQIDRR